MTQAPRESTFTRSVQGWKAALKDQIPIPVNLNFDVPAKFLTTQTNPSAPFKIVDTGREDPERIIGFSTEAFMKILFNSPTVYSDGTFSVIPLKSFYQLYTLHGELNNVPLPLAFFLLPNKTAKTYGRMIELVKNSLTGIEIKAGTWLMDAEAAMIKAVVLEFPNIGILLCFFHLSQSVYRKITNLGLKEAYNKDPQIIHMINCLKAVAFVPIDDVEEIFDRILDETEWGDFRAVADYFEKYYVGEYKRVPNTRRMTRTKPMFPPKIWNQFERSKAGLARTNNSTEAFNGAFSKALGKVHPTMWELFSHIQKEASKTHGRIQQLQMGRYKPKKNPTYKKVSEAIQAVCLAYSTYADKMDYIKRIAYLIGSAGLDVDEVEIESFSDNYES
jgi:hypothetical protein